MGKIGIRRWTGPGVAVVTLPHTRDLLPLHCANPGRYPFLLESVATGTPTGRFDILFAFPGRSMSVATPDPSHDFLSRLDSWWSDERSDSGAGTALPFRGGWFLFLAYELAQEVEPSLRLPLASGGLPVAVATRIPAAVISDHLRGETHLVVESGNEDLLDALQQDWLEVTTAPDIAFAPVKLTEDASERYLRAVERTKHYITEGDIFQANLSRRWAGSGQGLNAAGVYARLRQNNPGPFAGLATWGDAAVISSSPERLVRVNRGWAETRPIAGTLPRSVGSEQRVAHELLGNPKERAEHVMLIDLERNDLGRVCIPGSVCVDELMTLESYAHVHHIVSNVGGTLRPDVTPGAVIRAVFPGGTITGCPKVRCMEILAELEQEPRGAYTGSMGYLNRDGDMDLNILIRSISLNGDNITFRAGGGIVADSDPTRELAETRAKARGLLLALS